MTVGTFRRAVGRSAPVSLQEKKKPLVDLLSTGATEFTQVLASGTRPEQTFGFLPEQGSYLPEVTI